MSGKISYQLGLDIGPMRRGLAGAMGAIRGFSSSLAGLAKVGVGIGVVSSTMAVLAASFKGVKLAADLEQTTQSFEGLLKSSARAGEMLEKIQTIADTTSFDAPSLQSAAKSLLNGGTAAASVLDDLKMLGAIAAQSGIPVEDLGNIYQKSQNKGRAYAEELNQMSERGIPIMDALGESMGVQKDKVYALAETGKVRFAELRKAFSAMTAEGGYAFGALERQGGTFNGRLNTLGDSLNGLMREFGKPIMLALKPMLIQGSDFLSSLQAGARSFGSLIADAIRGQMDVFRTAMQLIRTGELGGVIVAGLKLGAVRIGDVIGSAFTAFGNLLVAAFDYGAAKLANTLNPFSGKAPAAPNFKAPDLFDFDRKKLQTFLDQTIGRARAASGGGGGNADSLVPGLGLVRLAMQNVRAMQQEMAYQSNETKKAMNAAAADAPDEKKSKSGIRAASSLAAVGGWLGGAGSTEARVLKGQLDTQKAILKVNSEIAKNTAKFRGGIFLR